MPEPIDQAELQRALDIAEDAGDYDDVPGWVARQIAAAYVALRDEDRELHRAYLRLRTAAANVLKELDDPSSVELGDALAAATVDELRAAVGPR